MAEVLRRLEAARARGLDVTADQYPYTRASNGLSSCLPLWVREGGLEKMLARCETPALRTFVRSVVQGETLGVSTGQIMRNLAIEMRKRRRAKAEERAQKAPIKMLFPLIFLIFPAMFVVLLFPAVYEFTRTFHMVHH